MRSDAFSAANIRRAIRYERTKPDGRRAVIVIRPTDGGAFSVNLEQVSAILDRVGAGETDFALDHLTVTASGDRALFAEDPAAEADEPRFKLQIN